MKKILSLLIIITFIFLSCDNKLDIEPQHAISESKALSNEKGVKTALVGSYDLLSDTDLWGGGVALHSELFAETNNQFWTGRSFNISQIFNKNIAIENFSVERYWIEAYETINLVNNVLAAFDVINDADRQQVTAEARFIRGVVYFDLVNLFAKSWLDGDPGVNLAIPLVHTPTRGNLDKLTVPRNTVAEIYAFILEDLLFAKANLPESNGSFATTSAASAMLSRVYLMQEVFELATTEANRVIESGFYQLLPDISQVFNQSQNTSEDIFGIQVTSQDGFNLLSIYYSGELEGGRGFIAISNDHVAKYEIGDKRAELFYFDSQNNSRRTEKWRINESKDGNITQIRLAEMYLTRAEGRFRMGNIVGALTDLNTIRNRAGLPSLLETEIDLETILKERYLELAFEGHLFRDTKRNRKNIGDIPFNDARMIYPIPQREMDVNGELVQNGGY